MDTTVPEYRTLYHCGSLPPSLTTGHYAAMDWFHRVSRGHAVTALPGRQPSAWAVDFLRGLARHDDVLEVVFDPEPVPGASPAAPAGYNAHYRFRSYRVREGCELRPEHVTYGDVDDVRRQVAALRRMHEEHMDLVCTPTLVSVPSPIDLALFTFLGHSFHRTVPDLRAVSAALRWLPVFTQAQIDFVNQITAEHGDDVAINLELPSALVGMWKARTVPGMSRLVARWHARKTAELVASFSRSPRVIVHECYGDHEHTAVFEPRDLTLPVVYANELAKAFDNLRLPLPELHMPATWGDRGPLISNEFYAPLAKLDPRWRDDRLHAGVVHERDVLKSALAVQVFEDALGGRARTVGFPCGWGRRTEEAADLAARTLSTVADMTSAAWRNEPFGLSGVTLSSGTDAVDFGDDPYRED